MAMHDAEDIRMQAMRGEATWRFWAWLERKDVIMELFDRWADDGGRNFAEDWNG
jgi:hypothetical protein